MAHSDNSSGGNDHMQQFPWMIPVIDQQQQQQQQQQQYQAFGDTTYTKVFVGGLAWETQSSSLRRYFERFGPILEAVVISDKHTGRSRGYGFVTFYDAESARRACADPNPIIDGRRANCNLAALGRTQPFPSVPYGYMRTPIPAFGSMHNPRGTYIRSPGYRQQFAYTYQPGLMNPPYGYASYGSEHPYSQGVYNPYMSQNYIQLFGLPRMLTPGVNIYGQPGSVPGILGPTIPSYRVPAPQTPQFGGTVDRITTANIPMAQASYPPTTADIGQQQNLASTHSPLASSSSDQASSSVV